MGPVLIVGGLPSITVVAPELLVDASPAVELAAASPLAGGTVDAFEPVDAGSGAGVVAPLSVASLPHAPNSTATMGTTTIDNLRNSIGGPQWPKLARRLPR